MKRGLKSLRWSRRNITSRLSGVLIAIAIFGLHANLVSAAVLTTASVTLSDPRPNTSAVTYNFQASNVTTTAIKCIRMEFDTAPNGTGGKPAGMNITGAALNGTSNYVPTPASWSPTNNDTTGVVTLTYATGETPANAAGRNVVLTGITNGSTQDDDYFLIVNTYNNTDCTTSPVDSTTTGFLFTNGQTVSVGVDGSLSFTIAGIVGNGSATVNGATITNGLTTTSTTIPFGTVTSSANKVAAQDLTVSTNSGGGYTVYTRYSAKPTSGANTIDDQAGSNGSPVSFSAAGTESFGYTTADSTLSGTPDRFTSSGGNKWAPFTTSNAEVAYNNTAVASQTTRVGFQVGVGNTTEPGSYITSVVYTSVPVY